MSSLLYNQGKTWVGKTAPSNKPIANDEPVPYREIKIPNFVQPHYASRRKNPLRWYMAGDIAALALGLLCAWGMAAFINAALFERDFTFLMSAGSAVCIAEFFLIGAGVLLWFHHTDHYHVCMPFWIEAGKIVSAMGFAAMAHGFLQFAAKSDFSRLCLMSGWVFAALATIGLRNVTRSRLKKSGAFQLRTLLVGTGDTAQHTLAAIQSEPCLQYQIVEQVSDLPKAFLQAGNSWETLCAMHGVDYVIIALDGEALASARKPLEQLARESVPFSVSPPLAHLPVMGMVPQYFMNHDIMLLARSTRLEHWLSCFMKRAFDIAVSAAALLVLSPLMLAVALLVKSDGGPALYAHMRVGRNKKQFPCLKFRSMVMNGDAVLERHLAQNAEARKEWEESRKLIADPRITRIGKFLRSSSLDELPQLINVLCGDMSLVGPRPIVNAEIAKYDGDIAHYYRVRPGVTGLWQVSGRSDVSYPRRVQMDSWYVRNWSLWHDIAILCKTVPALLNRTGAY